MEHMTHTSQVAAWLREQADKLDALDLPIPGEGAYVGAKIRIHRRQGDGTTNREAMAFADTFAAAMSPGVECRPGGGPSYGTNVGTEGFEVAIFPLTAKPVVEFNPDI